MNNGTFGTSMSFAPPVEAEALGRGGQTLADLVHLAPMVVVALWALLLLAADAFSGPGTRGFQRRIAWIGLLFAGVAGWSQLGDAQYDAGVAVFSDFLVVDPLSILLDLTVLAVTAGAVAFAGDFARSHRFEYGEQESLLLIAAFGVMILNHANTLLAMFLGIETMSIAVYVMVGARWNSRRSPEAALKYFIMGAFASGLLVMGIALIYGASGTLSLPEMGARASAALTGKGGWGAVLKDVIALERGGMGAAAADAVRDRAIVGFAPAALLIPGVLLVTAALLFKVSAVPFHMWTPDAYDGAPTPTTGFMAAAVKIGGFAALLKFLVASLPMGRLVHYPYGWATVVAVLAILTMTVGNLAAVRQTNVKRMLAYSSVAHVGYLLVGVIAAALFYVDKAGGAMTQVDQQVWARGNGDLAVASVLFYLVVYAIATLGAFACVAFYGSDKREATGLHEWAGMARRHPGMALGMTVCLLSLMGMPPIAGFFGKLSVFRVAMTSGDPMLRWLVIAGVVNAVIGASYYLRIIVAMYFRAPLQTEVEVLPGRGVRGVVGVAAVLSVAAGIGAQPLLDQCEVAAAGTGYRPGSPNRARRVAEARASIEARGAEPGVPASVDAPPQAQPTLPETKAETAKSDTANAEAAKPAAPVHKGLPKVKGGTPDPSVVRDPSTAGPAGAVPRASEESKPPAKPDAAKAKPAEPTPSAPAKPDAAKPDAAKPTPAAQADD